MSILACIQSNFAEALREQCSEIGCTLNLRDIGNLVIIKGEEIRKDVKICDCIVFIEDPSLGNVIGIVELKNKTAHVDEVCEKLKNGTIEACNILSKCSSNHQAFEFHHIVLCKSWRVSEHKAITSRNLKLLGKKFWIHAKSCGISFVEIARSTK